MKIDRFLLVLFLLALGGCTALKKRQNVPTITEKINLKTSFDQALSEMDFTSGDWPAWDWWTEFSDAQLTRFMNRAVQDNPDLKAAVARLNSSYQEARKVRSSLFPQLDTSFENNYQHLSKDSLFRFPPAQVPAVINQVDLKLNFEYEIDLFGKNRKAYRAAVGEARSQRAEMSQAYLIITTSLAEAYFNYQANLLRIDVQAEMVQAKRILFELTERRVLNKLDDEIALEESTACLLQAEEVLVNLQKDLALSKSQIKILMGVGPDEDVFFELPDAQFNRPFPLPNNVPVNLIVRRPDLMVKIWKVEAAAHLIGVARAAFFPNVNLGAFIGLETLSWSKLFSVDSFAASLAPAINLPLFTGWRLKAELEKSFADFDEAVFDYNSLILRAAKEVSDGLKILQATNREGRFQTETISHLKKATDLTYARFQNGVSNYLEVMQMKVELLSQVAREVDIQNNRHLAVLNLIRALGGGYTHEKIEVSSNG